MPANTAVEWPCQRLAYRKAPGLNKSLLNEFKQSAAHVSWAIDHPREDTSRAQDIGLLFEELLLPPQPDGFKWVLSEYPEFRTQLAKDWKRKQEDEGLTVFKPDEFEQVQHMVKSAKSHPVASRLLKAGKAQVGVFAPWDQNEEVQLKGLIDFVPDGINCLVDIKSANCAAPGAFARSVDDFGYHLQAAMYSDMWRTATGEDREFAFVVTESVEPYLTSVFYLDPQSLSIGREIYRNYLSRYLQCEKNGVWPGYNNDEPTYLSLPAWAIKQSLKTLES